MTQEQVEQVLQEMKPALDRLREISAQVLAEAE